MYENEFEELNLHLREAGEKIFKPVEMHDKAIQQNHELIANLREKAAGAESLRQRLYDLNITKSAHQREANRLREMLNGMTPKTRTVF